MKNTLKVNHIERTIVMDRTFAKFAENTRSEEYAHLQQVRKDYPAYTVTLRKIKTNPNKERYAGLTYDYMKKYIVRNVKDMKERHGILLELDDMIFISECHSKGKRYPTIKKWFLNTFPEVKEFGLPKEDEDDVMENQEMVS
jgi:hypothetical protein